MLPGINREYSRGMTEFVAKRIYELASSDDGYRVLVDRLWPRGVSKEKAVLDEWAKDIAPSTELRKWFAHDPAKYEAFTKRYITEVEQNPDTSAIIKRWYQQDKVTLLYGARDEIHNEAEVLCRYLSE